MTIERRHFDPKRDRELWLAWRTQDVTASTVPALFGCHPYLSALKLYLAKSGVEFPNEDNKVMRRGRWLEPSVGLAVAEERPEWQIVPAQEYLRDPDLRFGATPDFYIEGDPRGLGILQAKSVGPDRWHEWENGPPFWIQLQTLSECILADAVFGVAAALKVHAYDMEPSIHEIPRHSAAEAKIIAAVRQFWADVEAGNEPDADYGRDAELLKIIAPRESVGKAVDLSADNEIPVMLAQREEIMTYLKVHEERKKEIETALKFKMRDAELVTGLPEWSISWKSHHVAEHVVAAKDIRTLRINRRKTNG